MGASEARLRAPWLVVSWGEVMGMGVGLCQSPLHKRTLSRLSVFMIFLFHTTYHFLPIDVSG